MTYFDETGSVPDYKVVHDPIPNGACFGVEITHAQWRGSELLIHWFPIPPFEGPKREGWTVIGELEFQDPELCQFNVLGYRGYYSGLGHYVHEYGLGTPYGISDYNVCSRRVYVPILQMIGDLAGLNDDKTVSGFKPGGYYFHRKAESTLARFKGQKGWFDIL